METVRACAECNSALWDYKFEHPAERHEYIVQYLKVKYGLLEHCVYWSDHEIEELGPSLRHRIKKFMEERRKTEDRVLYATYVSTLLRADDEPQEEMPKNFNFPTEA